MKKGKKRAQRSRRPDTLKFMNPVIWSVYIRSLKDNQPVNTSSKPGTPTEKLLESLRVAEEFLANAFYDQKAYQHIADKQKKKGGKK